MKKKIAVILSAVAGIGTGICVTKKIMDKMIDERNSKIEKFKQYYNVLLEWFEKKQDGISLEEYFIKNGYQSIAVYGMGEMGLRFVEEMKNSSIDIAYAIDKNAANVYSDVEIKEPDDRLPEVDAIVVTSVFAYIEIQAMLLEKTDCPVLSLEEIVYSR